ncbi:MAG: adenylate/guanylate cyclase domain-containing protein [Rhizomicrobium sp.]|jgi:adenylate cyclase
MTGAPQGGAATGLFDRVGPASLGRSALTLAATLYVILRFGERVGWQVLVAALVILLLELVRVAQQHRSLAGSILDSVAAALQPAIFLALCFAPAPIGYGSEIPGRVMMDAQPFILALCFLASNADAANPGPLWSSGTAILLAWLGVRQIILSEPHIITAASIRMPDYKDPLSFLQAINGPHFFNQTQWQGSLVSAAMITAALGFGLYRTRRLARMTAGAEARRDSLAAFFAPQVVEAILAARDANMAPRERQVALLDCDLVGFTSMAEQRGPAEVATVLRAWRSVVEDAVFAQDGAILSHTGDGSVALFGLAGDERDATMHALAAAQQILMAWPTAAAASQDIPQLAIGLDFGPARAGLLGERMLSFVAAGAVLDSAAELQRETRSAGAAVLVGKAAFARVTRDEPDLAGLFERYENGAVVAWKLKNAEPRR